MILNYIQFAAIQFVLDYIVLYINSKDDQLYSIQYKRSVLLQISSVKRKTVYVEIRCLLPWGSYPAGRVGLSKSRFQGLSRTFPTCRARWLQGRQTRRSRCWPPWDPGTAGGTTCDINHVFTWDQFIIALVTLVRI